MFKDPDEIPPQTIPIEERILKALDDDFHRKSPSYRLSSEFKRHLAHYIHLTYNISAENTIAQILEFLKTAEQLDSNVSINLLKSYLTKTDFQYKKIKTELRGKFSNNQKPIES
jgi:hypothetical protein